MIVSEAGEAKPGERLLDVDPHEEKALVVCEIRIVARFPLLYEFSLEQERLCFGADLEDVEILDQKHNPPRRFVEPHPLEPKEAEPQGQTVTPIECPKCGSKRIGSASEKGFDRATHDWCVDCDHRWNDDPPAPEYEPIGTEPIVGDRTCRPTSQPAKTTTIVRIKDGHVYDDDFDMALCRLVSFTKEESNGRRIPKRPDAEAWASASKFGFSRLKVGGRYFFSGETGRWKHSSKDQHVFGTDQLGCNYQPVPPEVAAKWLAEVKKAGLL